MKKLYTLACLLLAAAAATAQTETTYAGTMTLAIQDVQTDEEGYPLYDEDENPLWAEAQTEQREGGIIVRHNADGTCAVTLKNCYTFVDYSDFGIPGLGIVRMLLGHCVLDGLTPTADAGATVIKASGYAQFTAGDLPLGEDEAWTNGAAMNDLYKEFYDQGLIPYNGTPTTVDVRIEGGKLSGTMGFEDTLAVGLRYTATFTDAAEQTTGIRTATTDGAAAPAARYNLQGQRLNAAPAHGVYIQDGRKIVVK